MRFCHRVDRLFVCKAKEGRHVRITFYLHFLQLVLISPGIQVYIPKCLLFLQNLSWELSSNINSSQSAIEKKNKKNFRGLFLMQKYFYRIFMFLFSRSFLIIIESKLYSYNNTASKKIFCKIFFFKYINSHFEIYVQNTHKIMLEISDIMDNSSLHPYFSNLPDRVTYYLT